MVGVVAAGGVVAPGDAVRLLPDRLPPLPRSYLARCRLVVSQVPAGRALTYEQLNLAVGGPGALVRILPRWLPRLAAEGLPAHRVVASYGELLEPAQARRLAAEGVPLSAGRLVPGPPWWSAEAWLLERDGAGAGNVPDVANPDVPGATAAGPPRR
jgi:alkylated DNA nucleotide flippase Atl1